MTSHRSRLGISAIVFTALLERIYWHKATARPRICLLLMAIAIAADSFSTVSSFCSIGSVPTPNSATLCPQKGRAKKMAR